MKNPTKINFLTYLIQAVNCILQLQLTYYYRTYPHVLYAVGRVGETWSPTRPIIELYTSDLLSKYTRRTAHHLIDLKTS